MSGVIVEKLKDDKNSVGILINSFPIEQLRQFRITMSYLHGFIVDSVSTERIKDVIDIVNFFDDIIEEHDKVYGKEEGDVDDEDPEGTRYGSGWCLTCGLWNPDIGCIEYKEEKIAEMRKENPEFCLGRVPMDEIKMSADSGVKTVTPAEYDRIMEELSEKFHLCGRHQDDLSWSDCSGGWCRAGGCEGCESMFPGCGGKRCDIGEARNYTNDKYGVLKISYK